MDLSEEYSLKYEKHTGRKAYKDGMYTKDFVEAVCRQHRDMKEAMPSEGGSVKDLVGLRLAESMFAATLAEYKMILTGESEIEVDLSKRN